MSRLSDFCVWRFFGLYRSVISFCGVLEFTSISIHLFLFSWIFLISNFVCGTRRKICKRWKVINLFWSCCIWEGCIDTVTAFFFLVKFSRFFFYLLDPWGGLRLWEPRGFFAKWTNTGFYCDRTDLYYTKQAIFINCDPVLIEFVRICFVSWLSSYVHVPSRIDYKKSHTCHAVWELAIMQNREGFCLTLAILKINVLTCNQYAIN